VICHSSDEAPLKGWGAGHDWSQNDPGPLHHSALPSKWASNAKLGRNRDLTAMARSKFAEHILGTTQTVEGGNIEMTDATVKCSF